MQVERLGLVLSAVLLAACASEERWHPCDNCIIKADLGGTWRFDIELLPVDAASLEPACLLPGSGARVTWVIQEDFLWARLVTDVPKSAVGPSAGTTDGIVGVWRIQRHLTPIRPRSIPPRRGAVTGSTRRDPWHDRPAMIMDWGMAYVDPEPLRQALGGEVESEPISHFVNAPGHLHAHRTERNDRGAIVRISPVSRRLLWQRDTWSMTRETAEALLARLGCPAWLIEEDHGVSVFLRLTFTHE